MYLCETSYEGVDWDEYNECNEVRTVFLKIFRKNSSIKKTKNYTKEKEQNCFVFLDHIMQ
jgi:hypothetical protein